jgi:uncharacterized protein (TIGR03437 family)
MKRAAILLLVISGLASGYIPNPIDGTPLHRIDSTGMQFLANQNIAPGIMTNAGSVWITADSAPSDAINSALSTWNAVSTTAARFLPLQMTPLSYNSSDGNNVIVFADDPFTESFTNGVVAITAIAYIRCSGTPTCTAPSGVIVGDETIADTDIFFSPSTQFSTTQAAGTFDLQSAVTHELGHAMGANHTNILSATMFAFNLLQDIHEQTLSADDIAFVSALYPAATGDGYGTISGHTLVSGAPLLGGAITAVDSFTGITVGGFSSITDGSYSLQLPPGNYFVYVEPAANLNLYLQNPQSTVVFTSFESGFAGGNSQPSVIAVTAGTTTSTDLAAAAGLTPLRAPVTAISTAGGIGDYHGALYPNSLSTPSGQSVDFLFSNPLAGTFTESNLLVLGPANVRAGSLRKDTITLTDGTPIYRITLDIPPLAANSSATVVFKSGTDILTRSGLLTLTRPQAVNAGSYLGGPVAPGEILSFFGSQLGPPNPANNGGFNSDGTLPVSLGSVTVSFDQAAAPLFYVSNNQINLQVPYEVSGKTSTLMTIMYNGTAVAVSTLSVAKSAPGIFVVTNADGSVNGPNSPSAAGGILVVYGTGAGITTGLLRDGAPAPADSTVTATVTINGAPVAPIFAGLTPGSVGLTQVNVAIPAGTPAGNSIPLQFNIAGNATQTVNIAVR